MSEGKYDAVIIGSGPGGYSCAIRVAQLGGKAAVIERASIGGTCTNVGCIPTKAMLASAKLLSKVKKASKYGVSLSPVSADDVEKTFRNMTKRRDRVVAQSSAGIRQLLESHNITVFNGTGTLISANDVKVRPHNDQADKPEDTIIECDNVVIATGTVPVDFPGIRFDGESVLSSSDILSMGALPDSLTIIGAGPVGIEFACIFNALGVKVHVLEMLSRIVPLEDRDISSALERSLARRGIKIATGAKVLSFTNGEIIYQQEGEEKSLSTSKVLLATGRRPNLNGLAEQLERLEVRSDKNGIVVDSRMQTNIPGIYAIGDVVPTPQLAHVAHKEGLVAAENIMGQASSMNYNAIPSCIYSFPEVASVGLTEDEARRSHEIDIGKFPFAANGRARTDGETDGFVKAIVDKTSKEILGIHIIGPYASELVSIAIVFIESRFTLDDAHKSIMPHPTLSEAISEALLDSQGTAIHLPRRRGD